MNVNDLLKGKYGSIQDILECPVFEQHVRSGVLEVVNVRKKRNFKGAPAGFRYKKDSVDKFMDNNSMNTYYFMSNIGAIWTKTSDLSSQDRSLILSVCSIALLKALSTEIQ